MFTVFLTGITPFIPEHRTSVSVFPVFRPGGWPVGHFPPPHNTVFVRMAAHLTTRHCNAKKAHC